MQYGPLIPEGQGHVILGFEPTETLRVISGYGNPNIDVIVNPRPNYPIDVLSGRVSYPDIGEVLNTIKELSSSIKVVEATELAKEAGDTVVSSVVMVGCLAGSGLIPIKLESYEETLKDMFSENKQEINLRALKLGVEGVKKA